jgi:hypothetical protein
MTDHETFAARWARRKLEAKRSQTADAKRPDAATPPAKSLSADDDTPLPSLDDITPDGDIAAFLQKRIPAELQRLALRKAWATDPAISSFIEVAENQYDWNAIDGVPGFGPMDPSWNIESLLAQATGAVFPADGDQPTTISTTSVVEVVASPECGELTQSEGAQATVEPASCHAECDAPHNAPIHDDLLLQESARPSSDLALIGLTNSEINDTEFRDIPEKTQRLALQHPDMDRRGRHGGALPE